MTHRGCATAGGPTAALAAVLIVTLLASACSANGGSGATGPSLDAPRSSSTTTEHAIDPAPGSDPDDRLPPAEVEWTDCGGGFECGTIDVPLDYDDPSGRTIAIALTRRPAPDPARRVGVLLVNPGGPGGSGIDLARSLSRAPALVDRFDLVGFDPRGVGDSTPIRCNTHLQAIYDNDPTIDSDDDLEQTLRTSEDYVDECEANHGDLLPHLGTTNVARDVDRVRVALGEEQISYLGYSYGTSIGQEYARQFPRQVRTMVLDGVVDHTVSGIEAAEGQAAGFTRALDAYVADCEAQGCGLGRPADEVVDAVIAAAERQPIAAPGADRPAGPGIVALALARALYAEQLWGSLSTALRDGLDGDGTGLVRLADDYLGRDADGSYDSGFEVYFSVSCLDKAWPDDPEQIVDAAAEAEDRFPRFGAAIVIDYIRCPLWPVDPEPLGPVPADVAGLAPVVVVSTTGDPATPYEDGVAVADQIPGAVLVTNEGEGHTIVAQGKPCIDDAVFAYLIDGTLPDDGLVCP